MVEDTVYMFVLITGREQDLAAGAGAAVGPVTDAAVVAEATRGPGPVQGLAADAASRVVLRRDEAGRTVVATTAAAANPIPGPDHAPGLMRPKRMGELLVTKIKHAFYDCIRCEYVIIQH